MASQFKVFTIPSLFPEAEEARLNTFLRSHRILNTNPEFISDGRGSAWSFVVEYSEGEPVTSGTGSKNRSRIDYREILAPDDFALFVKLREWRKAVAEADGVPVYTIFSNEQLATEIGDGNRGQPLINLLQMV